MDLRHDESWLDHNLARVGIVIGAGDAMQQSFGRDCPHFLQRLAHGGELRSLEGCDRNVVKPDNRNVSWNIQPLAAQCFDGTDCGDIVKRDERREAYSALQQAFGYTIAQFGR